MDKGGKKTILDFIKVMEQNINKRHQERLAIQEKALETYKAALEAMLNKKD